ncbi:cupredoxin domain-containing protein [Paenibacillus abyssi]|uniref:EfeO-type cupredoxin-like domain-containing protein n=1 Tax=Paenibacillus abyssi TaxID=1340531 RepID=A0A917CTP7_9BACL|nr:cupredoxin domain-containing protein [Paenibacillus abyssi]GGF95763.1 hypothetical protein GCM10010916_11340 [Paenibacillus abyssi]
MSKVFVISKKQIRLFAILALVVIMAAAYLRWDQTKTASSTPGTERVIHLITTEFKTKTADGKELEIYRFDPGTIVVQRGELIQLNITGINGQSHPFVIEGLNVKGEVKKGQTTVVRFTADQPGTYPILCLTHTEMKHGGPMVGYLVVQE